MNIGCMGQGVKDDQEERSRREIEKEEEGSLGMMMRMVIVSDTLLY